MAWLGALVRFKALKSVASLLTINLNMDPLGSRSSGERNSFTKSLNFGFFLGGLLFLGGC